VSGYFGRAVSFRILGEYSYLLAPGATPLLLGYNQTRRKKGAERLHSDSLSNQTYPKVQRAHDQRSSRWGQASTSNGAGTDLKEWKDLWKLKCSAKIKHFMWRLAHNNLALRRNLETRGMEVDGNMERVCELKFAGFLSSMDGVQSIYKMVQFAVNMSKVCVTG
jgi:hypothetical protein